MAVLKTKVDRGSDDFEKNREALVALVEDLRALDEHILIGGSARARERHLLRGKPCFASSYSVTNHLLALRRPDSLDLYDTQTQKTHATIANSKGPDLFSPDGKLLVTSNEAGKTVLWAIPTQ